MPKAKFADRGKKKLKSVKSKKVLNEKRQESRFGKKQLKGRAGVAVEYVPRTRAIKQMQVSIRDFRRLCILKGIYPRDPPHKRHMDGKQTYYHYKDISYLMHEPILQKFRQTKTFMKKFARAVGRRELGDARALYDARPVYSLDRIVKERYPRFADALGDLDDALSAVHLFAGFPAEEPVRTEHTALARRLAREWQYYVARTRSLRRAFLSIKGCYFQAEVRGVTVTWLVPWQFSQALPGDVDYRVMLTFLELHAVVLEFSLFKLFSDIGLAYPPAIRADREGDGAHLAALDVATAAAAARAEVEARAADAAAIARKGAAAAVAAAASSSSSTLAIAAPKAAAVAAAKLAALKRKLKQIARTAGATGDGEGGSEGVAAAAAAVAAATEAEGVRARSAAAASAASFFDFVDADADDDVEEAAGAGASASPSSSSAGAQMRDMAEFAESAEARAAIEQARKLRQFQRLFRGLVVFLSREVPRELFEFIVCAFRGRVGWDGPGSPYAVADARITHQVVDRPVPAAGSSSGGAGVGARIDGREYVQPQWVVDSLNARVLLPVAKYAPGAVLPPHLSPFVDDAAEGYVPAYRLELDRLRAAAAVTGRLADVIADAGNAALQRAAAASASVPARALDEDDGGADDGQVLGEDEDADASADDVEDDDDDEDDLDAEALMRRAEAEAAGDAVAASQAKRSKTDRAASSGSGVRAGVRLSAHETERRAMAASMLTSTQRRAYAEAEAKRAKAADRVASLDEKRRAAFLSGDSGTGGAKAAAGAAAAAAAVAHAAALAQRQGGGKKRARAEGQ